MLWIGFQIIYKIAVLILWGLLNKKYYIFKCLSRPESNKATQFIWGILVENFKTKLYLGFRNKYSAKLRRKKCNEEYQIRR